MVRVDASIGEGGGHIVREALSLSALTRKAVEIDKIGVQTRLPGLRHNHLQIARGLATVASGRLEGDELGSHVLRFYPGVAAPGTYQFALEDEPHGSTAVTELLYTVAPVLFYTGGRSELRIQGITHGPSGPSTTYAQTVFLRTIGRFGFRAEATTQSWGFSPAGGGVVRVRIEPVVTAHPTDLTQRGELIQIGGVTAICGLEAGFALRLKNRALRRLSEMGRSAQIETNEVSCKSPGAMIFLLAMFEKSIAGFASVYSDGDTAEEVADRSVDELYQYMASYSAVDRYLSDQILLYASLTGGESTLSVGDLTATTLATAELLRLFLPVHFRFDGRPGGPADITVSGCRLQR